MDFLLEDLKISDNFYKTPKGQLIGVHVLQIDKIINDICDSEIVLLLSKKRDMPVLRGRVCGLKKGHTLISCETDGEDKEFPSKVGCVVALGGECERVAAGRIAKTNGAKFLYICREPCPWIFSEMVSGKNVKETDIIKAPDYVEFDTIGTDDSGVIFSLFSVRSARFLFALNVYRAAAYGEKKCEFPDFSDAQFCEKGEYKFDKRRAEEVIVLSVISQKHFPFDPFKEVLAAINREIGAPYYLIAPLAYAYLRKLFTAFFTDPTDLYLAGDDIIKNSAPLYPSAEKIENIDYCVSVVGRIALSYLGTDDMVKRCFSMIPKLRASYPIELKKYFSDEKLFARMLEIINEIFVRCMR